MKTTKYIITTTLATLLVVIVVFGWVSDAKRLFVIKNNTGINVSWIDNEGQATFTSINSSSITYIVETRWEDVISITFGGGAYEFKSNASCVDFYAEGFAGQHKTSNGDTGIQAEVTLGEYTSQLEFVHGLLIYAPGG